MAQYLCTGFLGDCIPSLHDGSCTQDSSLAGRTMLLIARRTKQNPYFKNRLNYYKYQSSVKHRQQKCQFIVVKYISLASTECFSLVSVQNTHRSCWVLLGCFFSYLRTLVYSSPTNQHFYPNWRISYLFSEREGPLQQLEKTWNLSMA